jgi:hypothetical protein
MAARKRTPSALGEGVPPLEVPLPRVGGAARPDEVARDRTPRSALAAGLFAAVLAEITLGAGLLLARRGPPVGVDEAIRAGGRRPESVLAVSLRSAERRGDDLRLPLPREWQGVALVSLFAFVDGRPVPFSAGEPSGGGASVFTRSLRAGAVMIRCPPDVPCADAVLVRPDRRVALAIAWGRLIATPIAMVALAMLAAGWSLLVMFAWRGRAVPAPRTQAAFALALGAAGIALGLGTPRAIATLAAGGSLWLAAPLVGSAARRPPDLE